MLREILENLNENNENVEKFLLEQAKKLCENAKKLLKENKNIDDVLGIELKKMYVYPKGVQARITSIEGGIKYPVILVSILGNDDNYEFNNKEDLYYFVLDVKKNLSKNIELRSPLDKNLYKYRKTKSPY